MLIRIVCAWCGRFIGFKEDENPNSVNNEERISHGICKECRDKALSEIDSIQTNDDNLN